MKNTLVIILFSFCLPLCLQAQDVIVTTTGDEIQAKVLEITPQQVRYKSFGQPEGPDFILPVTQVFMVRFESGLKQVFSEPAGAQRTKNGPPAAPPQEAAALAPVTVKLSGPRLGVTVLGRGSLADRLAERYDMKPVMSQFGWQFETRLFTADNGLMGLVEWVPLIGGLDQGMFLPSISSIVGMRTGNGLEMGVGPNLSAAGAGLAIAAGVTIRTDYVYIPINLAVVPSRQGARYSLLTGFNLRKQ